MKIYTKTGDSGETGLFGGGRVSKDDPRMNSIGAVDELNAALGVVLAGHLPDEIRAILTRIQANLFELGADLASPSVGQTAARIQAPHLTSLEKAIDEQDTKLPPLTSFILPGGSPAAAQLHLARAACRRAERAVVTLADGQPIGEHGIA